MSTPSPDSPESGGMILRPGGFVRNAVQEPFLVAGRDGISMREEAEASRDHVRSVKEAISEIAIDENRIALLDGIEEYSHITVLCTGDTKCRRRAGPSTACTRWAGRIFQPKFATSLKSMKLWRKRI